MADTAVKRLLDTTGGPDALDGIQRILDELWSDHPQVPDVVCMCLSIAAAEVGANIIEHAGSLWPVRLRMEVVLLSDEVRIDFIDDGLPLLTDPARAVMPDVMAEGGRGLALARSVLHELVYRRNSHNHWTLVRRLSA